MKCFRIFGLLFCLSLLHFCNKKSSHESFSTESKKKWILIFGDYHRGFESEGEIMDVNFEPTLIGAFSPQTDKKIESDSISYFFGEFKEFANLKDESTRFYAERDSAFTWFDEDGLAEQADHLAVKLMNLEKDDAGKFNRNNC